MKKVLCLVVIFLIVSFSASAEGIDLKSMSLEELTALKEAVSQEIAERLPLDESRLYGGVYIVGKDIASGKYALLIDTLDEGYNNANVYLYENENSYSDNTQMDSGTLHCAFNGSLYLNLEDGMVVELFHGSGLLRLITPDYAP